MTCAYCLKALQGTPQRVTRAKGLRVGRLKPCVACRLPCQCKNTCSCRLTRHTSSMKLPGTCPLRSMCSSCRPLRTGRPVVSMGAGQGGGYGRSSHSEKGLLTRRAPQLCPRALGWQMLPPPQLCTLNMASTPASLRLDHCDGRVRMDGFGFL